MTIWAAQDRAQYSAPASSGLSPWCAPVMSAVYGIEASRLARNGRDWHRLIDLCALASTLVVDPDGAYDPRIVKDRLLLGLKGTMSEYESEPDATTRHRRPKFKGEALNSSSCYRRLLHLAFFFYRSHLQSLLLRLPSGHTNEQGGRHLLVRHEHSSVSRNVPGGHADGTIAHGTRNFCLESRASASPMPMPIPKRTKNAKNTRYAHLTWAGIKVRPVSKHGNLP
jgi:hypothetical protein